MPEPIPRFSPNGSPADFARGFVLPFRAMGLLFQSGRMFSWAALSAVVTLVSLVFVVYGSVRGADWLSVRILGHTEATLISFVHWLLSVLFTLVFIVVGLNSVPALLLSPLSDPLSEATDALLGFTDQRSFSLGRAMKGVGVSVSHTFARVVILITGHALLLLLNFVPGLGNAAWGVLSTLWSIVWLAAEYMGAPMARLHYPFRKVRGVLWARKAGCLGFGAAVYLLLWVPVLNFFFIPLAVIGGTLLFRGLQAAASGSIGNESRSSLFDKDG